MQSRPCPRCQSTHVELDQLKRTRSMLYMRIVASGVELWILLRQQSSWARIWHVCTRSGSFFVFIIRCGRYFCIPRGTLFRLDLFLCLAREPELLYMYISPPPTMSVISPPTRHTRPTMHCLCAVAKRVDLQTQMIWPCG